MDAKQSRDALYEAIQDPAVKALAEQAIGAAWDAGVRYGWKNAVGYIQDGMCSYTFGSPSEVGAEALRKRLRAAGIAEVIHHAAAGAVKTTCGYYEAAETKTVPEKSSSTCPSCAASR